MYGMETEHHTAAEAVAAEEAARYIKVKVVSQECNEIVYRLKKSAPLGKLMKSYSARSGVDKSELRFLFDGHRLTDDATPNSLDMMDDDVIEVYQEQTGGSC